MQTPRGVRTLGGKCVANRRRVNTKRGGKIGRHAWSQQEYNRQKACVQTRRSVNVITKKGACKH